ncbi:hypothetical protein [Limnohabitans sp. DM1]|uniref:hypothetical protein n=1 Tax=Limnohabitans sp. DM1 TaxID=1597955 RepID=UPI000A75E705|nr:hypothetical protein [Limnohabitans sp. DM1]
MNLNQDKQTKAKEERQQHRVMALYRDHSAKASTLTFARPDFDGARYDDDGNHITAAVVHTLRINSFGGQIQHVEKVPMDA